MGQGKKLIKKTHYCKKCGKKLRPLGIAKHMAMHRDKEKDKQTKL